MSLSSQPIILHETPEGQSHHAPLHRLVKQRIHEMPACFKTGDVMKKAKGDGKIAHRSNQSFCGARSLYAKLYDIQLLEVNVRQFGCEFGTRIDAVEFLLTSALK